MRIEEAMTIVLCRHCGQVMTEVPSGWLCECNGRIVYTPDVVNQPGDKRKALRERDARMREFQKRLRKANWKEIRKAMGLESPNPS